MLSTQNEFFEDQCETNLPGGGAVVAVINASGVGGAGEVKGTFNLHSNLKAEYVSAGPLDTVLLFETETLTCFYEVKKLKGAEQVFPALSTKFSEQKVKLLKTRGSGKACPKATFSVWFNGWYMLSGSEEAGISGVLH